MIIPIANAIYGKKFEIKDILKTNFGKINNLFFSSVKSKTFPVIKLKNRVNEYPASSIIINASNEILVDQFLMKNIKFNGIIDRLYQILRDKKFKKYAIKKTNSIQDILKIDNWARVQTLKLL